MRQANSTQDNIEVDNSSFDDAADAIDAIGEDPVTANGEGIAIDPYLDVRPFDCPPAFQVVDCPTGIGPAALKNRKIAHKFLSGWYIGTFKSKNMRKVHGKKDKNYGKYVVYYATHKESHYHDLDPSDYGKDKFWVMLKRR